MKICFDLRLCVASTGFYNVGGLGQSGRCLRLRLAPA